jgi:hypothetical protein
MSELADAVNDVEKAVARVESAVKAKWTSLQLLFCLHPRVLRIVHSAAVHLARAMALCRRVRSGVERRSR